MTLQHYWKFSVIMSEAYSKGKLTPDESEAIRKRITDDDPYGTVAIWKSVAVGLTYALTFSVLINVFLVAAKYME